MARCAIHNEFDLLTFIGLFEPPLAVPIPPVVARNPKGVAFAPSRSCCTSRDSRFGSAGSFVEFISTVGLLSSQVANASGQKVVNDGSNMSPSRDDEESGSTAS